MSFLEISLEPILIRKYVTIFKYAPFCVCFNSRIHFSNLIFFVGRIYFKWIIKNMKIEKIPEIASKLVHITSRSYQTQLIIKHNVEFESLLIYVSWMQYVCSNGWNSA